MRRSPLLLAALLLLASCSSLRSTLSSDWWDSPASDSSSDATPSDESSSGAGAFLDALAGTDDNFAGAAFLVRSYQAVKRANADLTPQQEYYLGRAFGATILATRPVLNNDAANRYINLVGQALARTSDRPETWSGYRFLLLDSAEVNAFAAPGGFIFVTKGLVKLTRNEDELAAVLAHEVAHVEQEHGLKAIRQDRLRSAVVGIGTDAAQTFGSAEVKQLTATFSDSIGDLTKTIVNNGYSRDTEFEADAAALRILRRAGYPPQALLAMLGELKKLPRTTGGFSKTHPDPQDRIKAVEDLLGSTKPVKVSAVQQRRYQAALGGL